MPRWALPVFVVGLWLMVTAGRVYWDARGRADVGRALQWAFRSMVRPRQYWWRERIDLLTDQEWDRVLERSLAKIGLNSPDDIHCPLCGGEMTGVLTVAGPDVTAAHRPAICGVCGFRLDACRHCPHFQPGGSSAGSGVWSAGAVGETDYTSGGCKAYREWRPVPEVCAPSVAKEMVKRGWESARAPGRIIDSYVPLENCTRFQMDVRRTRRNGVRELSWRHLALLRAWASRQSSREVRSLSEAGSEPGEDELWLI